MSAGTTSPSSTPSGRDLRRLTRQAMQSHGGGSMSELVGEVYTIAFSLVVVVLMVIGATEMLNATLRPTTAQASLDPSWLAVVAALALIGGAVGLAGRLGPLGVGGGQAAWWLPTPVDRRGLLRPRLLVSAVVAALVGALVGMLAGVLAGEQGAALAFAAGVGAGGGALGVLVVARGQVSGLGRSVHPAVTLGDTLVVAAPLVALGAAVLRPAPLATAASSVLAIAVVVLVVATAVVLLDTDRRLDGISGAELRARGAVTAYAAGAVTALDTRELGRALTITTQRDSRRRSGSFAWVRGPVSALVTGDALVTLRSRRHVIQVVVTAVVPIVVTLSGWPAWATLVGFVAAGYAAALATAEGARRAEMAPVLDRAFPIAANQVRRARAVWPIAVMAVWGAVTIGLWAHLSGLAIVPWVLLGAVAAPSLAAGAIRGAYRQPTDWSKPLVSNPMGPPIPPGLFGMIAKGPDVAIIGLVPLILGMVAVASPVTLFPWQAVATLIMLAIACRVPDPKGAFATAMQGKRP